MMTPCSTNRVCRLGRRIGLAAGILAASATFGRAQVPTADPNQAAIDALQTYELPDQTASVRLPSSWQVVATGVGFVQARGPNGELALFGVMIPAQDAGTTGLSSAGITQPYSADAEDKFLESIIDGQRRKFIGGGPADDGRGERHQPPDLRG